ncbi:MAG: hypothetical protein LBK40_00385, partial [Spirochaetaceae bacterium]|nr:hypothetical protein [Spirochaetaceae bacterium]
LVVAALITLFTGPGGNTLAGAFPYIVYAAPNCLFPLMALFIVLRAGEYRVFLPLYMAGKAVGVMALIGWLGFQAPFLRVNIAADFPASLWYLGLSLLVFSADIGTIFGAYIILRRS